MPPKPPSFADRCEARRVLCGPGEVEPLFRALVELARAQPNPRNARTIIAGRATASPSLGERFLLFAAAAEIDEETAITEQREMVTAARRPFESDGAEGHYWEPLSDAG